MSKVESLYEKLACEAVLSRKGCGISNYTKNYYEKCRDLYPDQMNDWSLEQFTCDIANFNPGKCNIGEKAQISIIQEKNPSFKKLSVRGKYSLSLQKENAELVINNKKTNISGIKSFDGIDPENRILYVLKTQDIGGFSDNEGGGHQDNVFTEIQRILLTVGNTTLTINGYPYKLFIIIDGRSAVKIIQNLQPFIQNSEMITVCQTEDL